MMEGWKEYRLDEFVTFQRGFDLPKDNFETGEVPVYGSTSILGFHNVAKVKAPGVITGRSGTLGRFQYANQDFWPHNTSLWVKDFKNNNPKFAYYLMQCFDFEDFNSGGAVPTLNRNVLRSFKVDVPPLATQQRIAQTLSAYDDLIENNLRRIKLLEEMAQITYEEWFVRLKFPRHENAIFDKETGLPEGWKKVKLGEVCDFRYGKMPEKELQRDSGYPIYSGYRITGYYPEFLFKEPTLIVVARGVGGTGDVKISPRNCWLTNLSIAVLVKKGIEQNYLYYHLKGLNLRYLDSGAAQSQITINSLENIFIIKPSEEFQHIFNDYVNIIFSQIENLHNQNQRLKEAREILLPRLMTGVIDVEKMEVEL